jgi:FixJ family two-component response regulator
MHSREGPLVYVVDPDERVRSEIRAILGSLGVEIREFSSAERLLESLEPAACSCVLTEVELPGMDGIELQRRLSESKPRIPVLVLAARADVPTAVAAMRAGAIDFFEKDLLGPALRARVRSVLALGRP